MRDAPLNVIFKSRITFVRTLFAVLAAFAAQAASSTGISYSFETVDAPGAGTGIINSGVGVGTIVTGINNAGAIVGTYRTQSGVDVAFSRDTSGYHVLSIPGAQSVTPWQINNSGVIVGQYADADGYYHPFIKDGSGYTYFQVPNSRPYSTGAHGINDLGQVVGGFCDAVGSVCHGYVRDPTGVFTTISYPGASATSILDINNSGQFVGNAAVVQFVTTPFVTDSSNLVEVTLPVEVGFEPTVASINNLGQIVGTFLPSIGTGAGEQMFFKDGSTYSTFSVPGAVPAYGDGRPYGLNDLGQIVGFYNDSAGTYRGFIATPVPVPSVSWLLAPALGVIGLVTHRRVN